MIFVLQLEEEIFRDRENVGKSSEVIHPFK